MKNVFALNAEENNLGEWIWAAVDSGGPRLIFPNRNVKWTEEYDDIDKSVFFIVEQERDAKEITVEFKHSDVAKTFYAFVDSRSRNVFSLF